MRQALRRLVQVGLDQGKVAAHVPEMVAHHRRRSFGVPPFEAAHDVLVIVERRLSEVATLGGKRAAAVDECGQALHHRDENGVPTSLVNGAMEGEVELDEALDIVDRVPHLRQEPLELLEAVFVNLPGGDLRRPDLEEEPDLSQIAERPGVRLDEEPKGLREAFGAEIGDVRAAPLASLEDADRLERTYGLADRRTRDAEAL